MKCPVCGGSELSVFFEMEAVPVFCNVLHDSPQAARGCERGDVRLGFCRDCGMLYNTAFEPERVRYAAGYENSLHGSPKFQDYAVSLADGLVSELGLTGGSALEIGGGRGEFLALLCRDSRVRGVAYDPSAPEHGDAGDASYRIVREAFAADSTDEEFDLVCTRHVLEHLPDPLAFLREIAAVVRRGADTAVYVEVPNGLWTLRDLGIWDIIYEHCSYFVPGALRTVLERAGLPGLAVREAFGGQFLAAQGRPRSAAARGATGEDASLVSLVDSFATSFRERVEHWSKELESARRRGARIGVWGAGSKGATFVNTVGGSDAVACLIDVNPLKHGHFVPGTGHRVLGPSAELVRGLDEVIVMNPLYLEEIQSLLAAEGSAAQARAV